MVLSLKKSHCFGALKTGRFLILLFSYQQRQDYSDIDVYRAILNEDNKQYVA